MEESAMKLPDQPQLALLIYQDLAGDREVRESDLLAEIRRVLDKR
jgi:hypothetical protein